ncbi:MAG: DNA topoisomerase I, partial [Actinomycetia bacterium]|nr:DNA topoisomerase I [Actinomycetes bacterium]
MAQLIITEKDTAARRIAEIVSGKKYKTEKVYNLPLYTVEDGTTYIFGLKGHLLKVDFPEDYKNWQEVNPRDLINARIIKTATKKNVLKALRKVSKEADKLIIATDFDREGELIGVDAANEVKKVNPDIEITRAKFSALTEEEVNNALNEQELPYYNLALAGEARQDIDLIWGATLTRFLSLASKRLGTRFLSVGRVQSPTLCLIALKEKEIREFKPVQYWQIKALLKDGESEFWAIHNRDRFLDNAEAKNIFEKLGNKGRVDKVESKKIKTPPPAPFNTTSFLAASSAIRITPSRAMFIAESLYMKGLISYPRVDNTVFPPSLKMENILEILKNQNELGIYASELIAKKRFKPTRGKKYSTDHPPIHPTGLARK